MKAYAGGRATGSAKDHLRALDAEPETPRALCWPSEIYFDRHSLDNSKASRGNAGRLHACSRVVLAWSLLPRFGSVNGLQLPRSDSSDYDPRYTNREWAQLRKREIRDPAAGRILRRAMGAGSFRPTPHRLKRIAVRRPASSKRRNLKLLIAYASVRTHRRPAAAAFGRGSDVV